MVAACHSEFAVGIFRKAGAKHVIGIKSDKKIQDAAILTFTQSFYHKIWKAKSKVCECFEKAVFDVTLKHGEDQSARFVLYKADEHETKGCPIIGNFK